jgi:hypothetical protein
MQKLILHGELGDDRFHPTALLVDQILLPDFEARFPSNQEGLAPLGERRDGDTVVATGGFQIGAMEQIQGHTRLPPETEGATAAASAFRIARQSPLVLGADPESGLVLDLRQLLAANECPPKS